MGRARKPLSEQKSRLNESDREQKKLAETLISIDDGKLGEPPEWLHSEVAKKEWNRVVPTMNAIGIVGSLDQANIGGYCNAFAAYVKVGKELKGKQFSKDENIKLTRLEKCYADEMRQFARLCGLTVDSRLKAAITKTSKIDDEIKEKFGDI